MDVLCPGAMLNGKSRALSLEDPVGYNPETGEAIALGEMLSKVHEDPASAAASDIDCAEFLDGHDDRYAAMVRCAIAG